MSSVLLEGPERQRWHFPRAAVTVHWPPTINKTGKFPNFLRTLARLFYGA
jgi:hypothetical protein